MSTSYVIPNISHHQLVKLAETIDDLLITDDGDNYHILMPIDPRYSLQKRINLGIATKSPPDNIQQGGDTAAVRLYKTEDPNNSWFEGTGVSINHPELILSKLAEVAQKNWHSEHDDQYWDYFDEEE